MAGYIRQSTFSDGDTITAALFNNEYDQLLAVFSNTSGHKHDGTAAEGPVIGLIGDAGLVTPLNKILIDTTNDHIEFWIDVSGTSTQQLYIADGAILPVTDNDIDLGSSSLEFKDLYLDGTANIDSLVADTADINGGTLDNVTIGGTTAAAGTFTTVDTSGNVTVGGNLTVSGTTTTVNSNEVNIGDNIIVLNSDETGTPSQNGGIEVERGTSTNVSLLWNETNDYWTFGSNHLNFPDNSKAYFGTSNDLEIYHDGSNSYIKDGGTGNLRIAGQSVDILNPDANEFKARFIDNDRVELYYDNSKKFETTSAGIDVTGSITASGIDNLLYLQSGATGTPTLRFEQGTTRRAFLRYQNAGQFDIINEYGDVALWTGTSGSESQKMTVKQDGKVGIGTASPIGKLDVSDGTNPVSIDSGSTYNEIQSYNRPLYVNRQGNNTILNSGGGNVGIGTASPAYTLDVSGSARLLSSSPQLVLQDSDESNVFGQIIQSSGALSIRSRDGTSNGIIKFEGNNGTTTTEYARFDSSGNLGIGISSPEAIIHTLAGAGLATLSATGNPLTLGLNSGANLAFDTNEIQARNNGSTNNLLLQKNGGNVGIGTSSPSALLHVAGDALVTGNLTVNGNLTFGNAATDTVSFGADIDSHIIPDDDDTYDLGSSSQEWKDLYIDGVIYADQIDLGDNEKIRFGASQDLQVYHTGFDSYIDNFTGHLVIRNQANNKDIVIQTDDGSGNLTDYMRFNGTNENINISKNVGIGTSSPSAKLDVAAGNITAGVKGVEISGSTSYIADGSHGTSLDISHTYSSNDGSFRAINIDLTDSGSSNQTLYGLYVNAEANYLSGIVGIGTTSPSCTLHLRDTVAQIKINSDDGQSAFLTFGDASDTTRGGLEYTSADALIFETNNMQERMRIDSSGNVGIGTTSPSAKLDINGGTDNNTAKVVVSGNDAIIKLGTNQGGGPHGLQFDYEGGQSNGMSMYYRTTPQAISFEDSHGTSGNKVMVIEQAGNVGIGTDSPSAKLHVSGSGNVEAKVESTNDNAILRISADSGGTGTGANEDPFLIFQSGGTDVARIYHDNSLNALIFDNNNTTERMRIDHAGFLLVGKTSGGTTNTEGHELKPDGVAVHTKDNGGVLFLNRKTSDGVIATFRKDNSTVGTIGSSFGNRLFIGDGDTAIRFADDLDTIVPWNASTNALRDNAIDLGEATGRFKDLYLGGNATIGGNLTVSGTTTTIDTTNLNVEDKNITINYSTGDSSSTADGAGITIQDAVDASTDATILWDATNDEFDFSHGITLPDDKRLKLGNSSDLQIYHNGSHSYIDDTGTGNLYIRANNLRLQKYTGETYISADADGAVGLRYDGVEKLATTSTGIDVTGGASFTSSVGIGTSSPQRRLTIGSGSGSEILSIYAGTGSSSAIHFTDTNTSTDYQGFVTYNHSADALRLGTAENERVRIDSSGNVGIGTTSPSRQLTVQNSSHAIMALTAGTSSLAYYTLGDTDDDNVAQIILDNSTNKLQIQNGGGSTIADRGITLDSSENVGIGTSSPANPLEIQHGTVGTGNGSNNTLALRYNSTTLYGQHYMDANGIYHILADNNGSAGGNLQLDADTSLRFATGSTPTERMRIDSSGNLCINSGSARTTGGTALLTLATSGTALNIGSSNNECMYVRRQDAGRYAFQTYNGGNSGHIHLQPYGGNVGIGTTTPDFKTEIVGGAAYKQLRLAYSVTDNINKYSGLSFEQHDADEEGFLGLGGFSSSSENAVLVGGGTSTFNAATRISFMTAANGTTTTGSERMRIDSSGNVGIGTTSPSVPLHVAGGSSGTNQSLFRTSSGGGGGFQIVCSDLSVANPTWQLNTFFGEQLAFGDGTTEKMRLDSSGRLLLGQTSSNGDKLEVQGNANVFAARLNGSSTGGQSYGLRIRVRYKLNRQRFINRKHKWY